MDDSPRSNVLFVVLDTVRKDRLGPYGHDRGTTPALSSFAEEAAVFESAIAPAPWTLPVHASLFTGRYPSQHGADQESPYLDGGATLASALSAAGYDTACYSSNAWITPYTGLTAGFDDHDSFFEALPGDALSGPLAGLWRRLNDSDRLRELAARVVEAGASVHTALARGDGADTKTPAVVDRTKSFVRDSDGEAGWFAFLNLMDAHLPYAPPERYRERFAPGVDPDAVCQSSKVYNAGAREIDAAEWEAIRGLYDAEIAHMDAELGRLFDWLRETGRWEETTVIVAADHGELHGEDGLYGHEFSLAEELINVPLLVDHPDLAGRSHEGIVELLDCYHTVLDAAGVDPAEVLDGGDVVGRDPTRSLLSEEYRAFEGAVDPDPGQRAVLASDADYAFVEYARPVIELHHLEHEAAEAGIDLPDDHPAYARRRGARRTDARYVRGDVVPDEGAHLDEGTLADDDSVAATERALARFETGVGGAWDRSAEPADGTTQGEDPLKGADDGLRNRLRELGYLE